METSDITVAILRDIRDEIRGVRGEQERMRLEMIAAQNETAANIVVLATEVRQAVAIRRDITKRVSRCEREIVAIKQRLP